MAGGAQEDGDVSYQLSDGLLGVFSHAQDSY